MKRVLGQCLSVIALCLPTWCWGAESHWAFKAPVASALPEVRDKQWVRNPIDAFILARLERENLRPSPEADRRTLIRRLSFDLLGLPPTLQEVQVFVGDPDTNAYEKLVERLLSSPHFGERWGRHWLDLARYADSDGYEKDSVRPYAYIYRDWVINAINSDMAFDQFTIEQLAGDLLPDGTLSQKVATGFQRQTLTNKEGGVDQEEFRCKATVDRTSTLGAVWLGLTVGCAECHTHKYDPISQREFYQLYAFFNDASEKDLPAPRPEELGKYNAAMEKWKKENEHLKSALAKHVKSDLAEAQAKWEQQTHSSPTMWREISPASIESSEGTSLKVDVDNIVVAAGKSPPTEIYTIEAEAIPGNITGIRLEVFGSHDAAAGRSPGGNFVLSEFEIKTANARGEMKSVPLTNAIADFSQEDWAVAGSIDGNPKTGWGIVPQTKQRHAAVFETVQPLQIDYKLVFSLGQQYGKEHTLARFRLSVTTSAPPFSADIIPAAVLDAMAAGVEDRSEEQKAALAKYYREEIDPGTLRLKKQLAAHARNEPKFPETKAAALVAADPPRTTQVHVRGDFLRKGEEVEPGTLAVLHSFEPRSTNATRIDLANWIIDPANPLTGRVTVNHIWKHLFGRGLVATVDDFGTRGEKPSNPELLDWLALRFTSANSPERWSRKALIRLIVTSATYRQSSAFSTELIERDPNNVLLARQNRLRLEAEPIRDTFLASSGLFMPVVGGPSVRPPLPGDIAAVGYANQIKWKDSEGADRYRRGLYTLFQRTVPYPMLVTFDAPDSNVTCTRRERSNTPLQALTLLNDPVFFECAQALGRRLAASINTPEERVKTSLEICLARKPTPEEFTRLQEVFQRYVDMFGVQPENASRAAGLSPEESKDAAEAAACVALARTVMNLDEFVTRE